jgi:hypothetical protein
VKPPTATATIIAGARPYFLYTQLFLLMEARLTRDCYRMDILADPESVDMAERDKESHGYISSINPM